MSYKAVTTYRVTAAITVDRPELRRGFGYPCVKVGQKCPFSSEYTVRTWRIRERQEEPLIQRHYAIARAAAKRGEVLGTSNYLYMRNVQADPLSL